MKRKGIALAGNILTDNVKMVGEYPQKGMLSTITEESLAVGGCVPNTAIDIKKVDPEMQIFAYGRVGNDDKGKYVLGEMEKVGIDVSNVKISATAPTSYSDVITVSGTGERTFFHNRGANKEFNPADVDLDKMTAKMLHAGYIMLLDSFDKLDGDTTPMAEFLKEARKRGIKTSIDLVSETSGSFHKIATAALPHCDYVIINEIEAGAIVGIDVRDNNGALNDQNVHVDFSVVNDMKYYNGFAFKGFIEGVPTGILSGGQYDGLMKKMGKTSQAIGFAVYLDELNKKTCFTLGE